MEDIDCVFYKICVNKDSKRKAETMWMEVREQTVRIRESSIRRDETLYLKKLQRPPSALPRRKSTSFLTVAP